jgi:hypothetical protein
MTRLELAADIRAFLEQHGKRSAMDSSEWNSPDGSEMEAAAQMLEQGLSYMPFSDFSSGGYKPLYGPGSTEAREWHDRIKSDIAKIRQERR